MKNKTLPHNVARYILNAYSRYYNRITDIYNVKLKYMGGRRRRIIHYKTQIVVIRLKNRTLPQ